MKRFVYGVVAFVVAFTLALPATADAKSTIKFKYPKKLDTMTISVRGIPLTDMDPGTEEVSILVTNASGVLDFEDFYPGQFIPNGSGTKWTFKIDRPHDALTTYKAQILEKYKARTGITEYTFKLKSDISAWAADPLRNPGPNEDELGQIFLCITVDNDMFYIDTPWERDPEDSSRPVKGWKLTDKYLQTLW